MKRIVTIQDISCVGKCSLTVALPIISAMGVEAAMIPTAVLSTHTMFQNFTFRDLTGEILPITRHWKAESIDFDAIYTGYLGSFEQIEIVSKVFDDFHTEDVLAFVDPVMADNGKLYPGFDEAFAKKMAWLCGKADIIVPNLTEAALMTGIPYQENYEEIYIKEMLQALKKLGAKKVVLTGVRLEAGRIGVMGLDTITDEYFYYATERVDASYHGTGDIFSSVCVGAIMRGFDWKEALKLAVDYTAETIKVTLADKTSRFYGVNFESTIPFLVNCINR